MVVLESLKPSCWIWKLEGIFGGFLKWWYHQNTTKWSFLVGKPMVVGYQHFRKPPFVCWGSGPEVMEGFSLQSELSEKNGSEYIRKFVQTSSTWRHSQTLNVLVSLPTFMIQIGQMEGKYTIHFLASGIERSNKWHVWGKFPSLSPNLNFSGLVHPKYIQIVWGFVVVSHTVDGSEILLTTWGW